MFSVFIENVRSLCSDGKEKNSTTPVGHLKYGNGSFDSVTVINNTVFTTMN